MASTEERNLGYIYASNTGFDVTGHTLWFGPRMVISHFQHDAVYGIQTEFDDQGCAPLLFSNEGCANYHMPTIMTRFVLWLVCRKWLACRIWLAHIFSLYKPLPSGWREIFLDPPSTFPPLYIIVNNSGTRYLFVVIVNRTPVHT